MIVPLVRKEARELLPLFALAALVQLVLLVSAMGWLPKTVNIVGEPTNIPFYNPLADGDVIFLFIFVGFAFAVLCGLWQTLSELMRGTFHFLLHRPLARSRIFGVKLAVGATACLLLTVLPILGYAVWAATPGTHASPFFWSLTGRAWLLCLGIVVIYLATFLSGLRPARWYGSRFWPVALALFSAYVLHGMPLAWLITAGALTAIGALYVVAILHVAYARDFS
ncbi:MAG TPA: hypothetical protein VGN12_16255 [Pirellulales bacterium]|jgi:ABC-type transport system involved in multi-copper enzyme maturation permease subunit